MYCQKCGNEVNENAAFCGSCGAKIEPLEEQPVYFAPQTPPKKKSNPLKIVIIVAIAVVFVIVLSLVIVSLLKADSKKEEVTEEMSVVGEYEFEDESATEYEYVTEDPFAQAITEPADTTAPTEPATQAEEGITAEKIINIFMDNKSAWMNDFEYGEYYDGQSWVYGFIDLDFDGIPELLAGGQDGSGRYTYYSFYKINSDMDGIEEIPVYTEREGMLDITAYEDEPVLYVDNNTGEMQYWAQDYENAGAYGYAMSDGRIRYNGGDEISEEYYFFELHEYDDGNETVTYSVRDSEGYINEVSQSEFEQSREEFFESYTNLNLTRKYVTGAEFNDASESQQYELLEESLEAFGYDGYEPKY